MDVENRFPKMIFTDDGWMLSEKTKITYADIENYIVNSFAGLDGAYGWSIGDHEVYHYETKIGERFGTGYTEFNEELDSFVHKKTPGVVRNITNNVNTLTENYGGPLTVISKICREHDVPFYPRIRMNSHYPIDFEHVGHGNFRREHPEWLIGKPNENIPEGTLAYGIRTGKNYAVPEVCSYMVEIICETFERFEVDGIELDFCRHPAFFRLGEERSNAILITGLISQIQTRLRIRENEIKRKLKLAVRVPPTVKDAIRIGLDVDEWIQSGLVDIVTVGIGFVPFDTPADEFVKLAENQQCAIYGCLEATAYADPLVLRAAAHGWLNSGATGVYLYNFYTMSPHWHNQTYKELTNRRFLEKSDKKYVLGMSTEPGPDSTIGWTFHHASPRTQLPLKIEDESNKKPSKISIEISDDLGDSDVIENLDSVHLAIRLENLEQKDEITLNVNGKALGVMIPEQAVMEWAHVSVEDLFWIKYPAKLNSTVLSGKLLVFQNMKETVRKGINEIEFTVNRVNDSATPAIIVGVELKMLYRKQ